VSVHPKTDVQRNQSTVLKPRRVIVRSKREKVELPSKNLDQNCKSKTKIIKERDRAAEAEKKKGKFRKEAVE